MAKKKTEKVEAQIPTTEMASGSKDNQNPMEMGEIVDSWYPDFLDKDEKSKTDEDKAAEYVTLRWSSMKQARSEQESVWEDSERAYRVEPGFVDESDELENWRSTHTTPLTHGMIETAVAEFIDSEPDFEISSQKESAEDNVKILKKIIEHTRYKGDYDYQKQLALRSIGIYGTCIWHEYYREDSRYIKTLTNYDEKTEKKTYEITRVTDFNDCYGEVISPWNFGVDEAATTMSEAADCIERKVMKWSDFKREYEHMPNFEEITPGGEVDQKEPFPQPEGTNDEDKIEVLFYENKPYDTHWIVANGKLLNDFEAALPSDHKQLSYAEGAWIKVPGHFWGLAMAQILAGVQGELDTNRRLRLDRAKLNVSKVFLTSAREDLSDEDVRMAPGRRISVQDPQKAIMPLEFSDTGASSYREEEALIEDARWATGISNPSQGVTTGSSATEAGIVKEATLKRLRASLATNKTILFERIGELRLANILQHYQDPIKVNKVTGKNGEEKWEAVYREVVSPDENGDLSKITVTPEDVRGNYTYYVKPQANLPLSKELEKEQNRQLFDKLIALPTTDPAKITRWLLKTHNIDPDMVLMSGIDVPNEELADEENGRMMQGAQLPPTQNATPDHTKRHYKFITENAWQIDENVGKVISDHINGELNPVSPKGIGQNVPPVGMDGAPTEVPPMPGEQMGPQGGPQGGMPVGLPMTQGGEMPTAADGGNPMMPDMSADQQLQR